MDTAPTACPNETSKHDTRQLSDDHVVCKPTIPIDEIKVASTRKVAVAEASTIKKKAQKKRKRVVSKRKK